MQPYEDPRELAVGPEHYGEIDRLLHLLLSSHRDLLGARLLGMYVFGSLVTGDFDYETSDIDLIASVSTNLEEPQVDDLKRMHETIALNNPTWADRIEVAYIPVRQLRRYSPHDRYPLISPGEPLHVIAAGPDWLINRFVLRQSSIALYGPPPQTLVDPISREELKGAVRRQAQEWSEWIQHLEIMRPRKYQAYAILTMCRALHTFRTGNFASKGQAAHWVQGRLPEWSSLIANALVWRADWRNERVDHEATLPETLRFIRVVIDEIVKRSG